MQKLFHGVQAFLSQQCKCVHISKYVHALEHAVSITHAEQLSQRPQPCLSQHCKNKRRLEYAYAPNIPQYISALKQNAGSFFLGTENACIQIHMHTCTRYISAHTQIAVVSFPTKHMHTDTNTYMHLPVVTIADCKNLITKICSSRY
jgi:hypothetical protein